MPRRIIDSNAIRRYGVSGLAILVCLVANTQPNSACFAAEVLSHPPLRHNPTVSKRPLPDGPTFFVDAQGGDDANNGSKSSPWRTLQHAVTQLKPGHTLCLREGVYYENVYIAAEGRADAPMTIRAFPGERAILDGSLREFFESPAEAWIPSPNGAPGEFRSVRPYPNIRNVVGCFGDSMIGLSTYFHVIDLRAENELWDWKDWEKQKETDAEPFYCGPGLWYNAQTGHIHARLSHTHIPEIVNYIGETEPRKLPLVIAPFRSVPLTIDGAKHLKLQDLVIRGGGYDTVVVDYGEQVEFDNVTIWCGTYGLRTSRTGPFVFHRSALYGNCPPWLFRSDTSKRTYPGRPYRDVTRLNTHATWVSEAGREFSVFATPVNDNWEVSYSEFTDSHDGPYLGGISMKFHHNLIENTQDDGVYLSQMYPRHAYAGNGAEIHIYQNVFRQCLTALAFGGMETTRDTIFIYRNLFDLRQPVATGRPSTMRPQTGLSFGKLMGDHGSPPWPAMNIYHNTVVMREASRDAAMSALGGAHPERPRRVFNNIFLHLDRLPGFISPNVELDVQCDGNLYWSPSADEKQAAALFSRFRSSPAFDESKKKYPPGFTASSLAADPRFRKAAVDGDENDYRLDRGSPAVDAGAELPADWNDPYRETDGRRPDIGALPFGAEMFPVGRGAE